MMRYLVGPTLLTLSLLAGCGEKAEPVKPSGSAADSPAAPLAVDAAPSMSLGRIRYAGACLGCHGPNGQGQGPFPKLAGKPAAELVAMLKDYRAGKKRGPQSATMYPFAKPLTDAEIDAIADYLAGL